MGPSLTFLNSQNQNNEIIQNNFDFRSGRQANTDKVIVPGFPNGLPSQVPEGVRIALRQAKIGQFFSVTRNNLLNIAKFLPKRAI